MEVVVYMSLDVINYWNVVKEVIKDVAIYIMPIAAFVVSLIALKRSNDTLKVQVQLSEVEEKLKEYELALKKHELEKIQAEKNEEKKANVEARIFKISKGSYRLKVWNSGNAIAYNIEVSIPEEYSIIIMKDKMPFEYLEPGNSFEEGVVIHMQSASKFKVISVWEDDKGNKFSNEQLRSC